LEVDHMVAVTAFVGRSPQAGSAALFGIRWGFGHALVVLLIGAALAWTGVSVPRGVATWAELGVGVMLVALGLWSMRASRRLHVHRPQDHGGHAHLHAHAPDRHLRSHGQEHEHEPEHGHSRDHGHPHSQEHEHSHEESRHSHEVSRHGHLSTLVGAVHGLAGTAPIVALIPVTLLTGFWPAIGYLAAFGVGTILAMGLYAFLAAVAARRVSSTVRVARGVALATGVASLGVGFWWIIAATGALT
jgi:ABC-type nickel/cobalt efflux system permease component RcnA